MSGGETFQQICRWVNQDDSPAILVCSDSNGNPGAANHAARRFASTAGIESWSDLMMLPDHEDWSSSIKRSCIDSTPVCGVFRLRRFDNAVRTFIMRAEPRYDASGTFLCHIVSAMDISDFSDELSVNNELSVQEIAGTWHERLVSISTVVSASTELIDSLLPKDSSPMCRAAVDKLLSSVAELRQQMQTLSSVSRSREAYKPDGFRIEGSETPVDRY